jgi:hypothetical protein
VAYNLIFPLLPEAMHPEVWQCLAALTPGTSLKRWLARIIEKVPTYPIRGPVSDDAEITLLSSPKAMRDAGLRLQNCLGTLIAQPLLQRSIYYLWNSPEPEVAIELQCLSDGFFLLKGVHAKGNGAVDVEVLKRVRAKFQAAGKVLVGAESAQAKEINRCAKLLNVWDQALPDFDDDEIIDLLDVGDAA